MKKEKYQKLKIDKTKNMKRYLLNFALLTGPKSSWRQTTGGQSQVLQMEKPGAKFNIRKLLAMVLLALIIPLWSSVAFGQVSQTWTSGGSFTVPSGVTSITITGVGGKGGSGGQDCGNGCGVNPGAAGGYTTSTFSVTPGTSLSIYVGSNGGNGVSNIAGGGNGGGAGGSGYASGGSGGGVGPTGASGGGGGGGGASAVIGTGVTLIAGGGGGGGGRCNTAGSGSGGSTSTGGSGSGTGANGTTPNIDGGGTGAGGGGYVGGSCGSAYDLNGEKAANGGNSGSSYPAGSTSSSSPYVTISYTAVGGSASASPSSICSGTSSTISLSGWAGTYIQWYYSTDGSSYYYISGATSSSYNTGNLTSARYYKADVSGVWSSVATVSIYALTSAPSSASCGGTTQSTASLSWGAGSGNGTITYYWAVGTSSGVTYESGYTDRGSTTGTTASANGLSANTGYYLRVKSSATCGESGYQTSAAFTTVPVAPVATTETNKRANSFTANWTASIGGASGYYLDVSTSATFSSYLSGYNNKSVGNVNTFSLSGLNRNTTYYYRVRGYNSGGQSLNSNTITFTTLDLNNFLVEKVGAGSIADQMAGVAFNTRITARDIFNTTVTDFTGTTTITTNSTLTAGGTTAAFSAGILASHSVTLTLTGTSKTLTATYSGSPVTTSTSNTFTVLPNILHHFTLVPDGTITAGTAFTVTATAYDVYNNIKTNYGGLSSVLNYTGTNSVNWTSTALSAPKGTARLIPANGNQTFTNGVSAGITGFTFYNSDQTQISPLTSLTITITDAPTSKLGTTSPMTVLNAPLDNFKVVAGITQTAGTAFTTTVTARDIYLNTCVDYAGSIRFKSSDDALVTFPAGLQSFAPANTNRGVMVYTGGVRINKIGEYWLRAADSAFAFKSGQQENIVVGPGAFLKTAPISIVSIDSPNKIAGQEVKVTLTPRDAQGNLLYACQNIAVLLDGVVKSGTHEEAHGTGSEDGVYIFYVPVTSTTAANIITATLGGTAFDQTYQITVTPAPPSLANTIITPDAGSMTTNGNQTVTVQLKDKFNNLRTTNDGVVSLTTTLGGFGGNNAAQTTTATYNGGTSGSYQASLYASYDAGGNGVGTAAITGSVIFNGTAGPGDYVAGITPYAYVAAPWPTTGTITDGASVTITEGLPNLVTSTISTDKSTMNTDETATITVQLKDFLGNLIVNNRGAVTLTTDRGVLSAVSYLSPGKYTATLTAGTTPVNGVGLATISGSFIGTGNASGVSGNFNNGASTPVNTTTTVDIIEGAPSVATIDISTAANQITADDGTAGGQTVVTVQLKDALGNLIVNDRGTVTLSTNLGVIYNGTATGATDIQATYLSPGKYTATFKMNAIGVGTATITGKYNAVAITDNAQVTVINGLATQLAISTAPALVYQPIAGVVFNAQPVIRILDHYGNLVVTGTGSTDVVTATRITSGTAALQGTTAKAAVAGIATFTDLSYNVAESIYIHFTSGTLTDQTSAAINVVHNVPGYMVITGSGTQIAGSAQTITIQVYDAYNNLANRFAGSKTLTFSGANQSPVTSSYPTVNGTTFGTGTAITFTGGVATASMNLFKEETVDIAANFTIGSYVDPAGYTGATAVNINAANSNCLHVVVAQAVPAYLAITGSATQVAGVAQTITITAYDDFNNPATGYNGDKVIRFAGANVSLVPSTNPTVGVVNMGSDKILTFTNGVATASMVLYKVESAVITATDQVIGTRTSGPDSQLAVNVTHAPANYYAVTGTSGTQTAGGSQNITVTAYDAYNNLATTYAGDVTVTFSGANPSPNTPGTATNPTVQNKTGVATDFGTATTITFTGGIATRSMSLYKVETANIVATAGSITTPVITGYDYRLQVAVNHAANSFFAITGAGTQTAGVSQDITVTMYDAYNNVATGYTGAHSLTFSGANPSPNTPNAATNPIVNSIAFGSATSLTFVAGAVTIPMNLYKVETAHVTATNGTQTADLHKLTVVVSHADQNYMAITGTGTQTAGVSQNITVTAYDAFNNVATRFTGSKSLTFSGANVAAAYSPTPATSPVVSSTAFGTPTSLTFASGVVTAAMNLYKVETALVTATNTDNLITITADSHKLSVVVGQSAPAYLAVTGSGTQGAGSSQTITITAYDAYNNVATAYTGSKNLVFTGANASAAASAGNNMPTPTTPATNPTVGGTAFGTGKAMTFANGVTTGSMTLYKTETAPVSVSDGTISSNASTLLDHRLSVLVNPALLYGFLVYNVPDPNDLGTWQPVTVQAIDTYNNTKTDYVGKITFSNTDIAATNPVDYRFLVGDAGIHTFTNSVKFSEVGLDWWLTALDLAEPTKYGAQSGITVQRAVTISANNQSKTYGNALALGVQPISSCTVTGIVSGINPIDGEITGITLTSAGSAATATVGSYPITPSLATGPYTPALYRIVYTTGNLTVNTRGLTLSNFLANAKTYDGTTNVTGTGFSDNRVNSDVLTFGYTAAFADRNFGTGKTVNYTGITISGGAGAGNYNLLTTSGSATANVAVRDINVTAQTDSKMYDGSNASTVLPVVEAVQTGDAVTGVGTQTFDTDDIGTSKVMTPAGTVINDGNSGANYAIHNVTNATGVITSRPITITVDAGQTKVYGEANPGSYTYTLTSGSLAAGDTFSGSLARDAGESVGTYAINKSSLTIVEGGSSNEEVNYAVTFVPANFTVTQRPITLTATNQSKTYGTTLDLGTTAFTKTAGTYASGESANAVVLASSGAINTAPVTTYPITIGTATGTGGFTASNYAITYTPGTLTVDKKELTVTATAGQTKVYGAVDPTFAYTAVGYQNGEGTGIFSGALTRDAGIHVGTTYTINIGTLSAGSNYTITYVSANFSITAKPVTITATTGLHKTYGDLDPASLTYTADVALAYSDVFSGILSRATGETVATYAIGKNTLTIVDNLAANVASDYNITYVGTTFAINQLAVTVTANSGQHKTYGQVDPTLTFTSGPAVGTALANGQTISFTGNVSRAAGETVIASPYYAIGQGTLANSNYAITYNADHFVIDKLAITGNFTVDATKVYDGVTLANVVTRTLNGVINSNDVTLTGGTANYDNKNIGTGKTVTLTGMSLSGTDAFNYSLTSVATTTADITVRTLLLSNFGADSKVYDGTTVATGTGFNDNRVLGDNLAFGRIAAFDTKDIGIGKAVSYSSITISGGTDRNNYVLASTTGTAHADITAAPITITADVKHKAYGTALTGGAGSTAFTVTGLQNSETISTVTIAYGTGAAATDAAGTYTNQVTPSVATGSSPFNSGNYSITYVNGNIIVDLVALTVTATNQSKEYGTAYTFDQTTPSTDFTVVGLLNSDAVSGITLTSAGASATAVVSGSPYTITPGAATGTGLGNYTIGYANGSFTVTAKALTVTATGPTKEYGAALTAGTSTTNFTAGTTGVGSETVTGITLTPDAAGLSAATTAGSAYVVTPSQATGAGGFLAGNYNITYTAYNGTVGKKSLTVSATGPAKEYGTALTAGTSATNFTFSGTLPGEAVTGVTLTPNAAGLSATTTAGSAYVVTPSLATGTGGFLEANYTVTYNNYNGTVSKKALLITAVDKSKAYGAALPTLTVSYTGLVNGDTAPSTLPTISTTALASSAFGTYPITATGAADANYDITYAAGTLTVDKVALLITADNKSKAYGAALPTLTVSYTGLVNGNTAPTTPPTISTTALATSNFGTYPITATGAVDANYTITYASGTLTVDKVALLITADNKSKAYGAVLPTLTVSYTGLVNGDLATATLPTISTTALATSNAGTYPISATGAADANYTITYAPDGTLNVTTVSLTITANDQSKCSGQTVTLTGTEFGTTGLVNGNTVTVVSLASAGTLENAEVNTYSIVPSAANGTGLSNYTITYTNGTLTVHPLPAAVAGAARAICLNASTTIGAASVTGSTCSWASTPAGFTSTVASPTVTPLVTTTYTVVETITATGCTNAHSVVVTVNPIPAAVAGADRAICLNEGTTIGAASVTGSTYNWTSAPAGYTSTIANPTVTPLVTTTYTVIETITATGCTNTHHVVVTVNPLPGAIAGEARAICLNTSTTIGAASVTGSTYSWTSIPAGFTLTVANPSVTPLVTTTYTVVETITATGCSNTHSVVITVNPLPAAMAGADRAICPGASTVIGAASVTGSTYSWVSAPAGFTSAVANPTVTPMVTTTYTVVETITATGCTNSHNVVVTVNPLPGAVAGADRAVCLNESTMLGAVSVSGSTYSWISVPEGFTSTEANPMVTPLVNTTYTVVETITATGCTNTRSVVVTVNPLPDALTGTDRAICMNESTTIGMASVTGSTYSWTSTPAGFTSTEANPGVTPLITTSYTLVETITATGCTNTRSVVVTVNPLPAAAAGADRAICMNESTAIGAAAVTGSTYSWTSAPAGFTSTEANPTVTPLLTTTYTVVETITATGCSNMHNAVVTVNPLPGALAGADRAICVNGSTTLGAASVTGSTYSWSSAPAGFTSTVANPSVTPLVTTTYTVVETITATGCINTHSVVVTVNPLPGAIAGEARAICLNANTTIGGASVTGSTYSWTSAPAGFTSTVANPTVAPMVNTTYSVAETITTTGCTNTHNVLVTVIPLPVPTITGSAVACAGITGVTYTTEAAMSSYVWVISAGGSITAGASTNAVTVTWNTAGAQSLSVNYANANGCTATSAAVKNVTVSPLPGTAGNITGTTAICAGIQGVDYSTSVISNAVSYAWTLPAGATIASGDGTPNIKVNFAANASSGDIAVHGTNACNNGAASSLAITVTKYPDAAGVITGERQLGRGTTGATYSVSPIANATSYTWSLPPGANIVSGANTNSITVDFSINAASGFITVYGSNTCARGAVSQGFAIIAPQAEFSVYPVPNKGVFTAKISSPVASTFTIRVFDHLGKKLIEVNDAKTVDGIYEKIIDLRPAPGGIYYLEFINGTFKETRKVLVNR